MAQLSYFGSAINEKQGGKCGSRPFSMLAHRRFKHDARIP
jgi:hypothetical protein